MSQVFISYKSEDKELHDKVKLTLQNADITCWSAPEIEPGAAWRDYIDTQLEQSFAVIVIVTNKSMKSHYVTYEWAWASGFGLPIIALLFEDTDIHPRLSAYQLIDCKDTIPTEQIVILLEKYIKESPLILYVNMRIMQVTAPFRILAQFSLWLYQYKVKNLVTHEEIASFFDKTDKEARNLFYDKLPEFWLSSSHAFTARQRREFRKLIDEIEIFWNKFSSSTIPNFDFNWVDLTDKIMELEKYRIETFEPLFPLTDSRLKEFSLLLDQVSTGTVHEPDIFARGIKRYLAGWIVSEFLPNDVMLIKEIIERIEKANS